MRKKRALLANLPSGVGVAKVRLLRPSGQTDHYYRVRLGKRFTGGKVIPRHFNKLSEAEEWIFGDAQKEKSFQGILDLKKHAGNNALQEDSKGINEALAALKRCREFGITLTQALDFAFKHFALQKNKKTVIEVVASLLKNKRAEGASDKHLAGMGTIFDKFSVDFGPKAIHAIARERIEEWIAEQDDVSVNTRISYARHLHILFNETVNRGWCLTNPTKHLKRNSEPMCDAEVWTPATLLQFLSVAHDVDPRVVAGLVIKAFAGVRTSELFSLEWNKISTNKIQIMGSIAKTRRSRGIPIQYILQEWLKKLRKREGKVVETNDSVWHETLQTISQESKVKMPSNVLRHSFGTYRYYDTLNENTTAFEMGNTPATVLRWYKAIAVEDEDVKNWWQISPATVSLFRQGKFDIASFSPIA